MTNNALQIVPILAAALAAGLVACGTSAEDPAGGSGMGGSAGSPTAGAGGSVAGETGGSTSTTSGGSSGVSNAGGPPSGGTSSSGGSVNAGGSSSAAAGTGGASSGGADAGSAGSGGAAAGSAGTSGGSGQGCTVGAWPAADPAATGPFEVVTETNVGPAAGVGEDGGEPVAFTMFRPQELGEGGRCHPVVTWGNGTGSSPSLYGVFLRLLASHGFVVIASDSPDVAQGDPPPMVVGVTWVLEQNDDPSSVLYQHIDTTHIGATGHSQGGFATTTAGGDSHITTIAPLCGASTQRNLHGPALIFCGGGDTTVPCDRVQGSFDAIEDQPAMFANYLSGDHANWVTFRGTTPSPVEATVNAWMRVHLMGDTALRSWFYGASCQLCTDTAWEISQKMMDE